MSYIDGFVAAVPTANRGAYKEHAEKAAPIFKEHGALKMVECWGDDVPAGTLTSFPMAVQKKDDETVVFSWIVWPSKRARDEGMKKVMADPRIQPNVNPMPFDGKRLIFGGFEVLLEAWTRVGSLRFPLALGPTRLRRRQAAHYRRSTCRWWRTRTLRRSHGARAIATMFLPARRRAFR